MITLPCMLIRTASLKGRWSLELPSSAETFSHVHCFIEVASEGPRVKQVKPIWTLEGAVPYNYWSMTPMGLIPGAPGKHNPQGRTR